MEKDRFTRYIFHELKGPLNAISLCVCARDAGHGPGFDEWLAMLGVDMFEASVRGELRMLSHPGANRRTRLIVRMT